MATEMVMATNMAMAIEMAEVTEMAEATEMVMTNAYNNWNGNWRLVSKETAIATDRKMTNGNYN